MEPVVSPAPIPGRGALPSCGSRQLNNQSLTSARISSAHWGQLVLGVWNLTYIILRLLTPKFARPKQGIFVYFWGFVPMEKVAASVAIFVGMAPSGEYLSASMGVVYSAAIPVTLLENGNRR